MDTYLRNCWYVAAWEQEIDGDALLTRTLLDVRRVMYRRRDGDGYVMLRDRCPHRFAPLSMGERKGDSIACRYHGLEFGPGGRCTHNPFSSTLPPAAVVDSPPVVARHGLLWFWPGDPHLADPARIPDFSFLDGQAVRRRCSRFAGHYELLSDNLMDLSHVDFLHRQTFNTNGTHTESRHEVRDGDGTTIWNTWMIPRVRKFPVLEPHFPGDAPIDQLTEMRWDAPASMMLRISWLPAGGGPNDARFTMVNPHIITPETATSSHYFWTCGPDDGAEAFARAVFEGEDQPVIEAVQVEMGDSDFWAMKPMILKGDYGAIRARRRLQRLKRVEAGAAVPEQTEDD
jgi:phenylpropionate dioxygenase-like ring-hydroxylating dioxygenase large terminal subunit